MAASTEHYDWGKREGDQGGQQQHSSDSKTSMVLRSQNAADNYLHDIGFLLPRCHWCLSHWMASETGETMAGFILCIHSDQLAEILEFGRRWVGCHLSSQRGIRVHGCLHPLPSAYGRKWRSAPHSNYKGRDAIHREGFPGPRCVAEPHSHHFGSSLLGLKSYPLQSLHDWAWAYSSGIHPGQAK